MTLSPTTGLPVDEQPGTAGGTGPATLEYDAILLAGFGGPEGPDDVMPFLRNVTRGRGIPDERLVEVSHHYLALDGISPINEQNRNLRAALETELRVRGVSLPVLWGNRNWTPFLTDDHRRGGRRRADALLGLATSAYSSYSSCRQYREDFGLALQSTGLIGRVRIDKVRPYFDEVGFVLPFIDGTRAAIEDALAAGIGLDTIEVVFTTHSIPSTYGRVGWVGSARRPHPERRLRRPAPRRLPGRGIGNRQLVREQHFLATGLSITIRTADHAVART